MKPSWKNLVMNLIEKIINIKINKLKIILKPPTDQDSLTGEWETKTAANPPRYKNYNQQPYTPYKQPNNTTSQQQPSVNNTTIKEDLIPIFTAALESTLPKYIVPTNKDETSASTTQQHSKNTIWRQDGPTRSQPMPLPPCQIHPTKY